MAQALQPPWTLQHVPASGRSSDDYHLFLLTVQVHPPLPGQGVAASGVLESLVYLCHVADRWSHLLGDWRVPVALGERFH